MRSLRICRWTFVIAAVAALAMSLPIYGAAQLEAEDMKQLIGGCSECAMDHGCFGYDTCPTGSSCPGKECVGVEKKLEQFYKCTSALADPGDYCADNYVAYGCGKRYDDGACEAVNPDDPPQLWICECKNGTFNGYYFDSWKVDWDHSVLCY